jgi:hypothetical protein
VFNTTIAAAAAAAAAAAPAPASCRQILPRQVVGLGRRVVVAVVAAKHHTLVATSAGEVFSFGSNKDGRLGYAAVDTQPTPRK